MTNSLNSDAINKIASEWKQFQVVNDRRLNELETKGSADPLTQSHLEKLNNKISKLEDNLKSINLSNQRPKNYNQDNSLYSESSNTEHKEAFCAYLRKGNESAIQEYESKNLSNTIDSDSGYLVTSKVSENITAELEAASSLRKIASVISISTDALEVIEDKSGTYSGWTSETTDYGKASDVILSKKTIPVHEVFAQPRVTQKILDDPRIDIEKWLSEKLTDVFAQQENRAFIAGDGVGKPKGILRYATNKDLVVTTGSKGIITSDSILALFYSLKETYSSNAKFLMSRDALQKIRMLKESNTGKYLWQPNYSGKGADTLLGAEVVECAEMPNVSNDALPVVIADFKSAYQIVDRHDIRVLRDPYTDKPFVKYYATKKVGGDVINENALRILRLS